MRGGGAQFNLFRFHLGLGNTRHAAPRVLLVPLEACCLSHICAAATRCTHAPAHAAGLQEVGQASAGEASLLRLLTPLAKLFTAKASGTCQVRQHVRVHITSATRQ